MVETGYSEPRVVALYDENSSSRHDPDFYAGRIGSAPQRIVDGCGTGSFAVRLAQAGHHVTGVDPAPEMLNIARNRPGHHLVEWLDGTAADLPAGPCDAAVMTGHAFQCILTDEQILATLTAVRTRLAPDGHLMFESRNPAAKAWLDWHSEDGLPTVTQSSAGQLEETRAVLDVSDELVIFEDVTRFESDGAEFTFRSTLRFASADHLAQLLSEAGHVDVEWFGDWDGGSFDAGSSREIIVIAQ